MKKYIVLMSIAALGMASCSKDYLETKPQAETSTSTIVANTDNVALSINGISRLMTKQYLHSQGFNGEGTIKTWYGNYPGNDFQKCNLTGWSSIINSSYHLNTSVSYLYYPWYYYYKLVSNANGVICNIDAAEGDDDVKAFQKAQALTFRAYSFFMLSQLYAHRWSDEQGNTPGIMLRLDQSTGDIPRSSLAATYKQIYKDLDEAIDLFQKSGMDRESGEFYAPNLNVAYAVYAKAALTREDWANAAKYAQLARQGYSIMSPKEYASGFNTQNSEWIWGVYDGGEQTIYYYSFFAYQGSNSSAGACRNYPCAISKELIDQIPETDVRRNLFLVPSDAEMAELNAAGRSTGSLYKRAFAENGDKLYSTSLVYAYMQFKHRASFMPGGGSFPIIRAAEMYYTEAEALCHLNQDAQAQQLLYEATSKYDAAYTKTASTGDALLNEVKLYRRFDLWGEGLDWFDYKRWKQPIARKALSKGGSFHTTFAITLEPSEANNWTWELPLRETDYNKAAGTLSDE